MVTVQDGKSGSDVGVLYPPATLLHLQTVRFGDPVVHGGNRLPRPCIQCVGFLRAERSVILLLLCYSCTLQILL